MEGRSQLIFRGSVREFNLHCVCVWGGGGGIVRERRAESGGERPFYLDFWGNGGEGKREGRCV